MDTTTSTRNAADGKEETPPPPSSLFARLWVRDIDVLVLFDSFFIAAVVAVVGVRMYLHATGFPKVGGSGLHISHMLWGGLLMVIALIVQMAFLTRQSRWFAAICGGLGFGLFIDELGKFITSDNNYFFKPTDALIYIILVVLFLGSRVLVQRKGFTQREDLANAIEILKEAAIGDLDPIRKRKALRLLAHLQQETQLAASVRELLKETPPNARPSRLTRLRILISREYRTTVRTRWFRRSLVAVFIFQALMVIIEVGAIIAVDGDAWDQNHHGFLDRLAGAIGHFSFIGGAEIVCAVVAAGLAIAGVIMAGRARETAYHLVEWSLLLSIFIIQPFAFYEEPYAAGGVLVLTVPLLVVVEYLLRREADRDPDEEHGPPRLLEAHAEHSAQR